MAGIKTVEGDSFARDRRMVLVASRVNEHAVELDG